MHRPFGKLRQLQESSIFVELENLIPMWHRSNSNKIETMGKPARTDVMIMADKSENKKADGIGSRLKKSIFSSGCGCSEGCCGARIVPKEKKEGSATKEE
jgi:hypothetical protein